MLDLYSRIDGLTTFQCSCLYFQSKLAMTGRPVRCGTPLRGPPVKQFRTHVYLSSFSCFCFYLVSEILSKDHLDMLVI